VAQAAVGVGEGGPVQGVGQGDLGLHVVDDGVHARHGELLGADVLAEEPERSDLGRQAHGAVLPHAVLFDQAQVRLDQEASRAAARIVDRLPGRGVEDARHERGHLRRREELARRGTRALRELAQQVLVGAAEEVWLHVVEAEAVLIEDADQRRQPVVVEDALAGGGGVEVGDVDDARQPRVFPGDGANGVGQVLAQPGRPARDLAPAPG
jgi:hypothetical protein